MSLSEIGTEVKMRGGPENDHPTGDFIWPCMHCDAEFHGEEYDYMCHKCAKEEDNQDNGEEGLSFSEMAVIIGVAIVLFGLILL